MAQVDVAIVVALEEEFEEFRKLLSTELTPISDQEYGGYDYSFESDSSTSHYRCVARVIGNKGPEGASLFADRMISRWNPTAIVMVGIAAGLHQDVRLGDVLVAEQVDAYLAETKAIPRGESDWTFNHRGKVFHGDHAFLQEIANLRFAHGPAFDNWQQAGGHELTTGLSAVDHQRLLDEAVLRHKPELMRVHLASGPVVGAARAFSDWLHNRNENIKALEMEAAGFVESAWSRASPVRALVIRGVSDLGDARKAKFDAIGGGFFRRLAMRNATRLLLTLLRAGVLTVRSEEDVKNQSKPQPVRRKLSGQTLLPASEPKIVVTDRWRNPIDGTVLLRIPASTFTMGSSPRWLADHGYTTNEGVAAEWESHTVRLSEFWIARTPVTNSQYRVFCQATGHPVPARFDDANFNGDDHPVIGISWWDAAAYLKWAKMDFPSEAQWERVATGGVGRHFPWGNDLPEVEHCNFHRTHPGTTPVARHVKGASLEEVLDLSGNVLEWCRDDARAYMPGEATDPLGPIETAFSAIRGGSFARPASQCRASYRDRRKKVDNWGSTGLRAAIDQIPGIVK
jgi:formylglycine-generating enzyme required for sulfatase activity